MPATERDIWEWISEHAPLVDGQVRVTAAIEKVGGFMGSEAGDSEKGKKQENRASGHTMFRFGASYGGLRMALIAAAIPFSEITPSVWQKGVGLSARKKTESKTDWKNRCKQLAQQKFPSLKVILATADALLIAEFCRLTTPK